MIVLRESEIFIDNYTIFKNVFEVFKNCVDAFRIMNKNYER